MAGRPHHHEYKRLAEELRPLIPEAKNIYSPIIVAMKGHRCTGRRLVAFSLAVTLRCSLLKEDDISEEEAINEPSNYQVLRNFVARQLQVAGSVVIDSELSDPSLFSQLQNLAKSTKTTFFIIECRPSNVVELWQDLDRAVGYKTIANWWDKLSSLEHLQRLLKTNSDYDIGEVPKLVVDVMPSGDFKKCVSDVRRSMTYHCYPTLDPNYTQPPYLSPKDCNWHEFGFIHDGKGNCTECHQHMSGPIYRCAKCGRTFHRSCSKLPQQFIMEFNIWLSLGHVNNHREEEEVVMCSCCKQPIEGYYYGHYPENKTVRLDLNCFFLPYTRTTMFHGHELNLAYQAEDYTCHACGVVTHHRLKYTRYECEAGPDLVKIDPHCAWTPETVVYQPHRHPFQLAFWSPEVVIYHPKRPEVSLAPRKQDDQYFCDFCEQRRIPDYWMYFCTEGCELAAHLRCLAQPTLPFLKLDND